MRRASIWFYPKCLGLFLAVSTSISALACEGGAKPAGADASAPAKADPLTPKESASKPEATPGEAVAAAEGASDEASDDADDAERAHTVVFADRTSQGYLLLVEPDKLTKAPTRDTLDGWVVADFGKRTESGEFALLRKLIATEPHDTEINAADITQIEQGEVTLRDGLAERDDLLGLYIERFERSPDVIDPAALADPIATRELDPAQREGIAGRSAVLLLRGDYRNQHDVRGLRLLQTLVASVARRLDALIFDPDTLETMGAEAFARRQLTANASNVVDQLAIIPFPDPLHPGKLRLTTRGMRRFGAPDLELDGLDRDPRLLQRASDFLAGLARVIVDAARVDASGLAVQADDVLELTRRDVDRAYADASDRLPPRCADCAERVEVHLLRRAPRDTDAREHLTVRVVAPRPRSDAADYDHAAWTREALGRLFDL